jgi:hypothetical protein
MYEPASVVLHKVSLTAGIDTPVAAYHSARSRMLFVRRHRAQLHPGVRRRAALDLLRRDGIRLAKQRRWRASLASCRGIASGLVSRAHHRPDGMASAGSRPAAPIASSAPAGAAGGSGAAQEMEPHRP